MTAHIPYLYDLHFYCIFNNILRKKIYQISHPTKNLCIFLTNKGFTLMMLCLSGLRKPSNPGNKTGFSKCFGTSDHRKNPGIS